MIYETVKGLVIIKWLVDKVHLIWFPCFVCLVCTMRWSQFFFFTVKQVENSYYIIL